MTGRIIEISESGRFLSVHRGFLVVSEKKEELGRVPLADIEALLITGHGNSLSTPVLEKMVEAGGMVVICGQNFHPTAMVWPMEGHHLHAERLRLQIEASVPLKKRLWQYLIRAKIANQSAVLDYFGKDGANVRNLIPRVASGDPQNCEAQASRRYWSPLMGQEFRRDPKGEGLNILLNYGYAVLRASCARAVSASGLHPALGIHHKNPANAFALVDDLMEPFRPVVDHFVKKLDEEGVHELNPASKKRLASVLTLDLNGPQGASPVSNCLQYLAQSLVKSFEAKKPMLVLPPPPLPLEWE